MCVCVWGGGGEGTLFCGVILGLLSSLKIEIAGNFTFIVLWLSVVLYVSFLLCHGLVCIYI